MISIFIPLFSSVLAQPVSTPLSTTESAPIIQPTLGDLKRDKPDFPSFYAKKDITNKNDHNIYLITKKETLTQQIPRGEISIDPNGWLFEERCGEGINKDCSSFDGKWTYSAESGLSGSFAVRNTSSKTETDIDNPSDPFGLFPLVWNPSKDVLYFLSVLGDSTQHTLVLFQFDPESKIFIKFPEAMDFLKVFNLSPDGKWIVWTEKSIHVYNVEKNIDYPLTEVPDYFQFYNWCYADNEDTKTRIAKFINDGKQFYLKHQFADAIQEYQKAIDLDSSNSLAYGYMGYSAFRMGDFKDSIRDLEKSIELDKWNKMSYYNLALVYWDNHQKERSIACLGSIPYKNAKPSSEYLDKKPIQDDPQFKEMLDSPEFIKAFGR